MIDAWLITLSSMGRSNDHTVVFAKKRTAELYANRLRAEWLDAIVRPIRVELLPCITGEVRKALTEDNRWFNYCEQSPLCIIVNDAKKKLTKEELDCLHYVFTTEAENDHEQFITEFETNYELT